MPDLLAEYDTAVEILEAARAAHDEAYKEADRIYRMLSADQREIVNQRYAREAAGVKKVVKPDDV